MTARKDKVTNRDNFSPAVISNLKKRASFICSNPDCRALTIGSSESDPSNSIFIGVAAHITAASPRGARYEKALSKEERASIENAIFLCESCAAMIDKNGGQGFSVQLLNTWKNEHEKWTRKNLNKSLTNIFSIVEGKIQAEGLENVKGLIAESPIVLKPGSQITASGTKNVTGVEVRVRK